MTSRASQMKSLSPLKTSFRLCGILTTFGNSRNQSPFPAAINKRNAVSPRGLRCGTHLALSFSHEVGSSDGNVRKQGTQGVW